MQKSRHNYFPLSPGLPPLVDKLAPTESGVRSILAFLTHTEETLERDNRLIYFDAIPSSDALPPLPTPAIIMQRVAYEEPSDKTTVSFYLSEDDPQSPSSSSVKDAKGGAYFDATSDKSAINTATPSSLAEGKGEPSTPAPAYKSADPGLQRSDSDLARELQARLNMGEDV